MLAAKGLLLLPIRACETCGKDLRRRTPSKSNAVRACEDPICRYWVQFGRGWCDVPWAYCVVCRVRLDINESGHLRLTCEGCGTPAARRRRLLPPRDSHGRIHEEDVKCIYCPAHISFRRGRRYDVCKRPECVADHRRYYKHLRREAAAMAGIRSGIKAGSSNPISLTSLGDRDGWRCQAEKCRYGSRKVRRDGGNDGLSPSVGHIIPVSALWRRDPDALAFVEHYGGLWVLENLRLEHKGCNSSARDRSGGQLRLIG